MNPQDHLEFHDRQARAMEELIDTLLPVVPKNWRQAELELNVLYYPLKGTRSIQHRLLNSITGESVEDFPRNLFLATTALHAVFCDHAQPWKKAIIKLTYHETGALWQCKTNYTYDP